MRETVMTLILVEGLLIQIEKYVDDEFTHI